MKRLLTVLLILVMLCTLFTGCEYLPEDISSVVVSVVDTIHTAVNGIISGSDSDESAHEHNFVLMDSDEPNCTTAGFKNYECSCGEVKEESIPALGHDITLEERVDPTCAQSGYEKYKCTRCSHESEETISPIGHTFSEEELEASRIAPCINTGCSVGRYEERDGKYTELIVYKFSADDEAAIESKHAEVSTLLAEAESYDPALHAYVEGSELAEAYALIEDKYEELYELIEYVVTQYQIAQVEYHVDMENTLAEENYSYISAYRTEWVAKFFEFSQPFYDSMYRDYFYYGMTEDEITEYLFESSAVSDEEYKKLVDRNTEIELAHNSIQDAATDSRVRDYYAEFVANNKRIAEIMGYDSYVEYAYANVYDRDYSPADVAAISAYVKEYISPIFLEIYDAYANIYVGNYYYGLYDSQIQDYEGSFFENAKTNRLLNDYIDLMAFTSNPDKQISFSDELNALMSNGNMFRGSYEGAYVTYLEGLNVPIAYFGAGYDSTFTVAHEFGHYMNEIYNANQFEQSFDLLEMHSQGNELLFLAYLEENMSAEDFYVFENYSLFNMMATALISLAVDTFEQAVYTGEYTGAYSNTIMEDGVIGANEYDLLFKGVLKDFGILGYLNDSYWRYVTIPAPCYYVSYSVSALSVLQLYADAGTESFESAKESYLKLFTYTDENPDMTTEQILEYAGMYSFNEEEMYVKIKEYFENN